MAKKQWRDDINSRVQELANEAAEAYVRSTGNCSHFTAVGLPNGFVQRFAELIAEECLIKAYGAKIRGESLAELIVRIKEDLGTTESQWYDEPPR